MKNRKFFLSIYCINLLILLFIFILIFDREIIKIVGNHILYIFGGVVIGYITGNVMQKQVISKNNIEDKGEK